MLPVEGDQMSFLQLCLLLLGLTRQEREERGREMGRERKGGRRERRRQGEREGGGGSSTSACVAEGLSVSETLQSGAAGLTGKLKQDRRT